MKIQAGDTLIPADKQTDELTDRHDEVYRRLSIRIRRSPVIGLEWPRGFQEVKVPRFLDVTGWW
jgi:hypothetical protein